MPSVNEQDHLWIAVGDIHDEPGLFARIPELAQADGIIVTGDLTITGGVKQADTAIFGIGASTFTPFGTPSEFPESTFAGWLENSWQKARKYPHTVLVSHNPPKDSACDVIPGNIHVGSTAVREFLEEAQPDVCLCGHIHEARAVDRVGRTIVVNPGALAQGGYVLLRSSGGKLSVELRVLENCD